MRIQGFTIVELLIVITVIGILAALSIGQFSQSAERGRDRERHTDITGIKSNLEEYYQDQGGYPSTVSTTTLPRAHSDFFTSPSGTTIMNQSAASDEYSARQMATPTIGEEEYLYIPYPSSCSDRCKGYILTTAIEQPTNDYANPYIISGAYNN